MNRRDITNCLNDKCPLKKSCCRFVHLESLTRIQLWCGRFSPDPETGICKHYWPLDTIELDIQTTNQEKGK